MSSKGVRPPKLNAERFAIVIKLKQLAQGKGRRWEFEWKRLRTMRNASEWTPSCVRLRNKKKKTLPTGDNAFTLPLSPPRKTRIVIC